MGIGSKKVRTLDLYQVSGLVDKATRAMRNANVLTPSPYLRVLWMCNVNLMVSHRTISQAQFKGSYCDLDRIARVMERVDRPDNPYVLAARSMATPVGVWGPLSAGVTRGSAGAGGSRAIHKHAFCKEVIDYLGKLVVSQGAGVGRPLQLFPWERRFIRGALRDGIEESALSVGRRKRQNGINRGVGCKRAGRPISDTTR